MPSSNLILSKDHNLPASLFAKTFMSPLSIRHTTQHAKTNPVQIPTPATITSRTQEAHYFSSSYLAFMLSM